MRQQNIDFAPRSFARTLGQTRLVNKLLAVIGVALCLVGGRGVQGSLARLDAIALDLRRAEQQLETRTPAQSAAAAVAISEGQAAAVNAAVKQLNLPWRDVLEAVEAGTPKSLGLLSLEPDAKRNIVKIGAEAASSIDMIDYVQRLKQQPFLTSAFVIKHVTTQDGGDHPFQFEVEASWRSALP
jgi:Tfp pilus assembly protein PilN